MSSNGFDEDDTLAEQTARGTAQRDPRAPRSKTIRSNPGREVWDHDATVTWLNPGRIESEVIKVKCECGKAWTMNARAGSFAGNGEYLGPWQTHVRDEADEYDRRRPATFNEEFEQFPPDPGSELGAWRRDRALRYADILRENLAALEEAGAGYDSVLDAARDLADTALWALCEIESRQSVFTHGDPAWRDLIARLQVRADDSPTPTVEDVSEL